MEIKTLTGALPAILNEYLFRKGVKMADQSRDPARWLPAARAGSREALGQVLEECRRYLLRIANQRLAPDLQAKGGASDIVQQTFLEAQRDFAGFQGETEAELRAWLRQLLVHNLANFRRHYLATDKRQVGREIALEANPGSTDPGVQVVAGTPSPSREVMDREEAEVLRRALERLPEEFRQVIALRHHEQRTFEEIARLMNRSPNGARTLWLRAVEQLAQELETTNERG